MKRILLIISMLVAFSAGAYARDVHVNGYTRNDGTYVEPHYRTAPNNNYYDNYSSQGNTNPYTGQQGTVTYEQYQSRQQQNNNSSGLYGR